MRFNFWRNYERNKTFPFFCLISILFGKEFRLFIIEQFIQPRISSHIFLYQSFYYENSKRLFLLFK